MLLSVCICHLNFIAFRKAKFVSNFGLSECKRVNNVSLMLYVCFSVWPVHPCEEAAVTNITETQSNPTRKPGTKDFTLTSKSDCLLFLFIY